MIHAWLPATRTLLETGAMPRPTGDRGPCLAVRILRACDAYLAIEAAPWTRDRDVRVEAQAEALHDLVECLNATPIFGGHGRVRIWESRDVRYVSVDGRVVIVARRDRSPLVRYYYVRDGRLSATHHGWGLHIPSRAEREEAYRARKNASRAAARAYEQRVAQVLAALRAGRAVEYMDGQHGGRLSVDGGQTWVSCPRIERELEWTGDRLGAAYVVGYRGWFSVRHVELERCIPPREYHSTWRWREEREMEWRREH